MDKPVIDLERRVQYLEHRVQRIEDYAAKLDAWMEEGAPIIDRVLKLLRELEAGQG
jgi:hypothetical protein